MTLPELTESDRRKVRGHTSNIEPLDEESFPTPPPTTSMGFPLLALNGDILSSWEGERERVVREILRIFDISPQELGITDSIGRYE